ncbi:MAG: helix-turn-helix transcriptional regulator [Treponema sp.]|nr:helix-turn-helix transcriptional regulator [Treponema sp.]
MGFKENLKSELQYRDMTVKELASLSGVKKQTLDNYLSTHNSKPSVDAAVKIARALKVSVEYLVTGEDSSYPMNSDKQLKTITSIYQELSYEQKQLLVDISQAIRKNLTGIQD